MRKLLLGVVLLAAAAGLAGCHAPVAGFGSADTARARPLDNFGEILTKPEAPVAGSRHGARPDDNFGEIL